MNLIEIGGRLGSGKGVRECVCACTCVYAHVILCTTFVMALYLLFNFQIRINQLTLRDFLRTFRVLLS